MTPDEKLQIDEDIHANSVTLTKKFLDEYYKDTKASIPDVLLLIEIMCDKISRAMQEVRDEYTKLFDTQNKTYRSLATKQDEQLTAERELADELAIKLGRIVDCAYAHIEDGKEIIEKHTQTRREQRGEK